MLDSFLGFHTYKFNRYYVKWWIDAFVIRYGSGKKESRITASRNLYTGEELCCCNSVMALLTDQDRLNLADAAQKNLLIF